MKLAQKVMKRLLWEKKLSVETKCWENAFRNVTDGFAFSFVIMHLEDKYVQLSNKPTHL